MEAAERNVYSVSELTRRIKQTLDDEVGRVWVEGEISNFKLSAAGHAYFDLKDAGSQLPSALFAGSRSGVTAGVRLENGQRVRAFGEITVFEKAGRYQLIVRKVESLGDGDLMRRFEELKRRLQAEGLFDAARKQPLPKLPQRIGVVTSPAGAVIHDILTVLGRRFPNVQVRLAPVKVQGEGAAEEIAEAIALFNRTCGLGSEWPVDLLIVGRGGGSLEDLWAFNEECVARAVAGSAIPVISAVGHEVDFTLCDFAADLRAPTPSAAAELAVPPKAELEAGVLRQARALRQALEARLAECAAQLERLRRAACLRQPRRMLENPAQRLDTLSLRMGHGIRRQVQSARQRVSAAIGSLLMRPERVFRQAGTRLGLGRHRMERACAGRVERMRARVAEHARHLTLLNPLAVLDRGYSLTRTASGKLVRSTADAAPGEGLVTRVRDGVIVSDVRECRKEE
ncbi:MAG: exodeoxyribonuclease VII large subunit [Kiritimatiellae bacterium]|nr:exodeoxyribonuclease VII large subunit [Kiritimatiellia bacterium]